MKKISAFLILLFISSFLFATEIKKEIVYEQTFEKAPSIKEIKEWIPKSKTEMYYKINKEDSTLILGEGFFTESPYFVNYNFDFNISVTNNTVRIVYRNMTVGTGKQPLKDGTLYANYVEDFYKDLQKVADALFAFCKK